MSHDKHPTLPPMDQERFQQILHSSGYRILSAALEMGPLFAPGTFQAGSGQLFVAVHVGLNWSPGPKPREWTACERDIFTILETSRDRLTAPRILEEMDRRNIIHGESTLTHALAVLVKEGVLLSHKKAPRGYCIATSLKATLEDSGAP